MHCVKCGTAIPESGSFCPKCGTQSGQVSDPAPTPEPATKTKNGPGCLKIGLGIFAVLIVLGVIGNLLPKPQSDGAAPVISGSEVAEVQTELPVAVTAKELFSAYEANEASAQGYFGNREFLVTGIVDKVALDFMDNPEVLLQTTNQFMSAHAALAEDAKESAGQYGPGDSVKLLCADVSEVASIPKIGRASCRERV